MIRFVKTANIPGYVTVTEEDYRQMIMAKIALQMAVRSANGMQWGGDTLSFNCEAVQAAAEMVIPDVVREQIEIAKANDEQRQRDREEYEAELARKAADQEAAKAKQDAAADCDTSGELSA